MHLVVALVILANVQLAEYFGIAKHALVTLALMFMIVVVVNDCMVMYQTEDEESESG